MEVAYLYNYFIELHIDLNNEWLKNAVSFLHSTQTSLTVEKLAKAVYEQWLYSNLKDSSISNLQYLVPEQSQKWIDFHKGMILQIESIVDISKSFSSQCKTLTYELEDNSGFTINDQEQEDKNREKSAKRMLLLKLGDGITWLKAIEYQQMPAISLLTSPGCKVMLLGRISYRRNTLLLNDKNCILLGGENDSLLKSGRPVEVMSDRLEDIVKLAGSTKAQRSLVKRRHSSPILKQKTEESTEVFHNRPMVWVDGHITSASPSTSQSFTPKENKGSLDESAFFLQFLNDQKRKRATSLRNSNSQALTECIPFGTVDVSGRLPLSPQYCPKDEQVISSSTSMVYGIKNNHVIRDAVADSDLQRVGSISSTISEQRETLNKQNLIKTTIKEEPEEEVYVIEEVKATSSCIQMNMEAVSACNKKEKRTVDAERVVAIFLQLGIVSIADALKASRFCIGSRRRKVAAVVCFVAEPLRIVDDLWTMSVCLIDESFAGLNCIIAHSVLIDLIGMTPEEAKTVRASNDKARRREGTARLKSVKESIERLDLIWEIEFYTSGRSTPVVRNMDTLPQLLHLVN